MVERLKLMFGETGIWTKLTSRINMLVQISINSHKVSIVYKAPSVFGNTLVLFVLYGIGVGLGSVLFIIELIYKFGMVVRVNGFIIP